MQFTADAPAHKTAPSFLLEAANAEDFEAVLALRIRVMRESLERLGRFDPARARQRLAESFDAQYGCHIVQGGARRGFLTLKPQPDGSLRLEHLYIEPCAQGEGLGSAVLAKITREADAAEQHLLVGVLDKSDALRFYMRAGFACVSRSEFDWELHRPPAELGHP